MMENGMNTIINVIGNANNPITIPTFKYKQIKNDMTVMDIANTHISALIKLPIKQQIAISKHSTKTLIMLFLYLYQCV